MHKLSNIVEKTADCVICGPVEIRIYNINGSGKHRYRCMNSYKSSLRTRKKHAGLNADERIEMIKANPYCDICAVLLDEETAKIDHDHATGNVRGVLCNDCNLGLGWFKDDIIKLKKAIRYLRRSVVN